MANMLLFGNDRPAVYRLDEIYIYDRDMPLDPVQSGKTVPAKDSIIVDNSLGQGAYKLYIVANVDNEGVSPTYEADLVEISNNTNMQHRMVNYGDNMLLLYFERNAYITVPGATQYIGTLDASGGVYPADPDEGDAYRISVGGVIGIIVYQAGNYAVYSGGVWSKETVGLVFDRLIVDRKLMFMSNLATQYAVVNDSDEIISINLDDIDTPPGTGMIPMLAGGVGVLKSFVDCAVLPANNPNDGDVVHIRIYDAGGVMLSECNVMCREASGLGSLSMADKVLVDMDIVSPEGVWNGENLVLSIDGDPASLDISTLLAYGDGTTEEQEIDDAVCFIYGLDDIDSSVEYAGDIYEVVVKYFLPNGLHSTISEAAGSERFIAKSLNIEIETPT